ncbi:unnamed protein product [Rotaria sp. Silwood1]|nr:unnamed protein product [Rotaria sp. Silwood1]CAF3688496.1 unnamed protein product [Rotaria sp. Silwood1]
MNNSLTTMLMDQRDDIEFTWHLILFSELVCARGDTLLIYKQMIMSVFLRCIHVVHKDAYEAIAMAAKNLLKSLSDLYPIDYRLSVENIEEPFIDFLPIRYAVIGVTALCRLQKPPRIYMEKSIDEILRHVRQHSPIIIDEKCYPGDREDNLWVTINNYKPPDIQIEWEQTCFLDKPFHGYYKWPNVIKYCMNKRVRYTRDTMPEQVAILYDRFIDKNFVIQLAQSSIFEEDEGDIDFSKNRFQMYKSLFRNFGLVFVENFMEQLYALIRETTSEKQNGSHRVAAEITAGMIRGSKYWTLEMLDELWKQLKPFLTEVCNNFSPENRYYWGLCFKHGMENQDPRRMHRLIDFICSLVITNQTMGTTFNETSRWYLVEELRTFQWRIPSIWCAINDHAKTLLDHPFKTVRENIADVLSMSLSFDTILPNGKSTRHPNIDQFIDSICKRLHQAIEVYEKTPLVNISGQVVEIDFEAHKALNLIETGTYAMFDIDIKSEAHHFIVFCQLI